MNSTSSGAPDRSASFSLFLPLVLFKSTKKSEKSRLEHEGSPAAQEGVKRERERERLRTEEKSKKSPLMPPQSRAFSHSRGVRGAAAVRTGAGGLEGRVCVSDLAGIPCPPLTV